MSHGRDTDKPDEKRADEQADERDERAEKKDGATEQNARVIDHLTGTFLRVGLAAFGFVLLLFALGQAIGFDMLGVFTGFLGSPTGQWLSVAVFALAIIFIAMSGWQYTSETV